MYKIYLPVSTTSCLVIRTNQQSSAVTTHTVTQRNVNVSIGDSYPKSQKRVDYASRRLARTQESLAIHRAI